MAFPPQFKKGADKAGVKAKFGGVATPKNALGDPSKKGKLQPPKAPGTGFMKTDKGNPAYKRGGRVGMKGC